MDFQQKLKNKQLQFELDKVQQFKTYHQNLRKAKHDFRNRLITLYALQKNNHLEAMAYLEQLLTPDKTESKYFSNHSTINFIINNKLEEIQHTDNITYDIKCWVPHDLKLPPDLIAVVLGNLLDNSIAALNRDKISDTRFLKIHIRYYKTQLMININNTFLSIESKKRSHRLKEGIGLKNVEHIVELHHGIIDVTSYDNVFSVKIIIPI